VYTLVLHDQDRIFASTFLSDLPGYLRYDTQGHSITFVGDVNGELLGIRFIFEQEQNGNQRETEFKAMLGMKIMEAVHQNTFARLTKSGVCFVLCGCFTCS
jgi:hypothetical protein